MDPSFSTLFQELPAAGELRGVELAKLVLKAGREKFDGSVVIQSSEQNKAAFRFVSGNATRWFSSNAVRIVSSALAELLPPEQLAFVAAHAAHQKTDELTAILRLGLLPEVALRRVHRDCTILALRSFGDATQVRYRFYPGQDYFAGRAGMNHPIDALVLVAETLLHTPDLEWARMAIQPFRLDPLALRGRITNPELEITGPLRQVVSVLRRQPSSFDALRLKRVVPEDALVACIYALVATDSANVHRNQAGRGSSGLPGGSISPGSLQSSSFAPGSLAPGSFAPGSLAPGSSMPRSGILRTPATEIDVRAPDSLRTASRMPFSGISSSLPGSADALPPSANPPLTSNPPLSSRSPSSERGASSSRAPNSGRSTGPQVSSPHSVQPRDENAVESAAMDAWMKTVSDPSCLERALSVTERAAERFPNNARILFYYGCLLVRGDRSNEAEIAMRRVLKLDPDHIEAQYELRALQRRSRSQSQTRPAIMGLFGGKKTNSG